jgi:hypothetical protein
VYVAGSHLHRDHRAGGNAGVEARLKAPGSMRLVPRVGAEAASNVASNVASPTPHPSRVAKSDPDPRRTSLTASPPPTSATRRPIGAVHRRGLALRVEARRLPGFRPRVRRQRPTPIALGPLDGPFLPRRSSTPLQRWRLTTRFSMLSLWCLIKKGARILRNRGGVYSCNVPG